MAPSLLTAERPASDEVSAAFARLTDACAATERAQVPAYAFAALRRVAEDRGVPVRVGRVANGTLARWNPFTRRITLGEGWDAGPEGLETLTHEIAHSILHRRPTWSPERKASNEMEAEAVAYVVCQHLGVDSLEFATRYISRPAGKRGEVDRLLHEHSSRIAYAAETIIEALDAVESEERS